MVAEHGAAMGCKTVPPHRVTGRGRGPQTLRGQTIVKIVARLKGHRRRRDYAPRCDTPTDPRWRAPVDPPEFTAELDFEGERASGVRRRLELTRERFEDFGVPSALKALGKKDDES
jgi:hypothetical protein